MRSSMEAVARAPTTTDEMLIEAVAQGDQGALSELYDRYAAAIFGLTLKITGQREVAEELTQEVFLRVWRRAGTFSAGRAVAPWLFGIAHNIAVDDLRRQRARPQPVYEDPERPILTTIADDGPAVEEEAWHAEQRRAIFRALDQLPPDQRQVLELAYYGGLTQREIADRTGSPLGTIKTRARLGLLKLRDLLIGQGISLEE
jgi:RNA polymerase sigma-70 factor (ECF subfamily)